jgi:multidrug transporter EmrE-like cation transporter
MSTFAPIVGWLACFAVLNVLVKGLSLSAFNGSLLQGVLAMAKSPTLYVAGILYVACALLYFFSLSRLPLSTAGPVFMVLGVVTTGILGFSVFGEPVGTAKLMGIAICLAGTALIFYDTAQ